MKILITNHCLYSNAGTENYVFEIAQYFAQHGHNVYIFSPLVGKTVRDLVSKDICITNNLKKIQNVDFDVIHAHHNKTAMLVRKYFPYTPMIFFSHGVLPSLEQPPESEVYVSLYGAVSEEVKENIVNNYGIEESRVVIVRNFVDLTKFRLKKEVNASLKNVLVVSNHYSGEVRQNIESVCNKKNLSLVHIGLPDNSVDDVENYINDADLVITLGKGVLESLACKRNVIVYDIYGSDGFLKKKSYYASRKNNFSGRQFGKNLNEKELATLFDKYDPENHKELHGIIKSEHSIEHAYEDLIELYKKTMKCHHHLYGDNNAFCSEGTVHTKDLFLYKLFILYVKIRHLKKIQFFIC